MKAPGFVSTRFIRSLDGLLLALALFSCGAIPDSVAAEPAALPPATERPASGSARTLPREMSLFDGKTLTGWRITDFAGKGEVKVEKNQLVLGQGVMTGVTWTNPIPRLNYEVTLDAMRVEGSDFFCGLTFPVGTNCCSLILGGWGGSLVGLSCLDGEDAANNETTQSMTFTNGVWYDVRLRVNPTNIQAWVNDERLINVGIADRRISVRWEMELSQPFGIATWATAGAVRNLYVRRLD